MADHTARFSNWFQIISNVAIIFGLGLVVYELNQSKQLAYVQFFNDSSGYRFDRQIAIMGEDPREALAKAALHPEDLSERDVVTLQALYRSIIMDITAVRISNMEAGLDRPWRLLAAEQTRRQFSTEPGRRWLRSWAESLDVRDDFGQREIAEIAEQALQDDPRNYPRSEYELLLAND